MNAFVTGGTGWLGSNTAQELIARRVGARALVLRPRCSAGLRILHTSPTSPSGSSACVFARRPKPWPTQCADPGRAPDLATK